MNLPTSVSFDLCEAGSRRSGCYSVTSGYIRGAVFCVISPAIFCYQWLSPAHCDALYGDIYEVILALFARYSDDVILLHPRQGVFSVSP